MSFPSARPAHAAAAGRFAYVTDFTSNQISAYSINAGTGVLAPLGGGCGVIGTGPGPASPVVDPSGRFLYVINQTANTVSFFTINCVRGCLIPAGVFGVGAGPFNIGISASGTCLYVSNTTANTVQAFNYQSSHGRPRIRRRYRKRRPRGGDDALELGSVWQAGGMSRSVLSLPSWHQFPVAPHAPKLLNFQRPGLSCTVRQTRAPPSSLLCITPSPAAMGNISQPRPAALQWLPAPYNVLKGRSV